MQWLPEIQYIPAVLAYLLYINLGKNWVTFKLKEGPTLTVKILPFDKLLVSYEVKYMEQLRDVGA